MSSAAWRAEQTTPLQIWVPLPRETQDFKGSLRLSKTRVNPSALAMTSARVVNLWETWGLGMETGIYSP
jgi:hypothetical protein